MNKRSDKPETPLYRSHLIPVHDTVELLSGKWKIEIICSLTFGKKFFMELKRDVIGISPRMLSKELQELEVNGIITRLPLATKPITVSYELSDYGKTLVPVIHMMGAWGRNHRKRIIGSLKVN